MQTLSLISKAPVLDSNYQTLLNQATTDNVILPSIPEQIAGSKFITDLKGYGIWSATWDCFQVYVTTGPNNFTLYNWINPATNKAARTLDPTFTIGGGVSFNGVDNYIDTGYNPSTGTFFQQNNCEIIIDYRSMPSSFSVNLSDGARQSNGASAIALDPQNASGKFGGFINEASVIAYTDAQFTTNPGLRFLGRSASNASFAKEGSGARVAAAGTSLAVTNNNIFLGVLNQAGAALAGTWSARGYGLFCAGRLLTTTEEANFKTAWDTFLATISALTAHATIGTIYNKSQWSAITDGGSLTDHSSGSSISGSDLSFTGGTGAFTKSLDVTNETKLDKWQQRLDFTVGNNNATSFGPGIGIRSSNTSVALDVVVQLFMATGANQGKLIAYAGSAHTNLAVTSSALTFSVGDKISMTVTLSEDILSATAFNASTLSASVSITNYNFSTGSQTLPNTGRFAIFNIGGNFKVNYWSVSSTELYKPRIVVLGDSKTQFYKATRLRLGWAYLLRDYRGSQNVTVLGGGNDRSAEYLLTVWEIINRIKPDYVFVAGISNDIRTGVASGTWQANYTSEITQLQAAGITVIADDGLYETSVDQSAVTTWLNANYPNIVWASNATVIGLNADNVHPNNAGCVTFTNAALASGKLPS